MHGVAHLLCTRAVDSTGLSLCPGRSFLFWYTYADSRCRAERLGGGGVPSLPSSAITAARSLMRT